MVSTIDVRCRHILIKFKEGELLWDLECLRRLGVEINLT
jgi:hypothetical protein